TPVSTASQYGFDANVTFGSDATTMAASYWSAPLTAAASYTIPSLYNYFAGNVSKGAGSSVTNQYGFYVAPLSSATNNWAVYTAGSTPSYFGGNVGIGTTSPAVSLDLGSRTDALALPTGTAAQEPASPASGWIRF